MTTTETDVPSEESEAPGEPPAADAGEQSGDSEPPALDSGESTRNEPLWTRGILPLALPILAALATAIWVINLSRAFLAGGSTGALIIVMVVTISIMVGASLMSAAKRLRTGSSVMLVATLLMIVVTAGIITVGTVESHGEGEEASGYVEPDGPPVDRLNVEGLASTKFDSDSYTVGPGVIEIVYEGAPGHTLKFKDPELSGFTLVTPGPDKIKADLEPGDYEIYCNVAGHEAQGMVATVTVESGEGPPPGTPTSSP